ncbi:ABC transporter permease [Xylanibacter oryzae]|uniref:ABC transporter permease n=1 Tax=Xylanibacter oryzae TaxID=185293 RepID=UPI0004B1C256|nr:ABC transporter permease [Xylanibacter oryzae]
MNFPLYIAKKIYNDKGDRKKVSRPAIKIATLGVAIGLAVMIISVCVVLGFKHSIRDKVIGFGSHIQVEDIMALNNQDQYPICINDSMVNVLKGCWGIKHVQKYALKQGILKTDKDFLGIMFKGIGPDYDINFLKQNLKSGEIPKFSDSSSQNKLVISQIMASKLKLKVGDKVFAYFISKDDVRARRFKISGIYQTNMTKFDQTFCYTDIYTAIKLNGWENDQCSGAELQVKDFSRLNEVENVIVKKVNRTIDKYGETYASQTIIDANPQVFAWLNLLDLNVWVIMALMICVAGFTMISGLLIIILERTTMIGVLKALGAKNKTIRHTFLWFAVFIIGKGLIIGDALGLGLLFLQKYTGLIKLDPTTYYVNTVPIEINIPFIIIINVITLIISIFVLIAPSYLISHIHPARSMHFE